MLKLISSLFVFIALFSSCRTDKPQFADLYVVFNYNGTKIDTSTTEKDQVIFTNFDGSPKVYIPNYFPDGCDNKMLVGTFPIGDTISWHLRLVEPDGSPQLFQLYFNEDGEPITLTESLHFIKPSLWNFQVTREFCDDQMVVVIGN